MTTPTISVLCLTRTAAAALVANRFVTAAGGVPAAGAAVLGVTRTDAESGDLVPVDVLGTTEVVAGAAVTAGATVMTDNQGRAVAHSSTNVRVGVALSAATAAGQSIEVLLLPNAA